MKSERISSLLLIIFFSSAGCITPPSITFTQTQTAAEKQIVGEKRDLEDNGWLIASAKTSSSGSEDWRKPSIEETYGKRYTESARLLVYLDDELQSYKRSGYIGESFNGEIHERSEGKPDEKDKKRIAELISLVNKHRKVLLEERVVYEKKRKKTLGKLEENLKLYYFNQAKKGEYVETEPEKWIKK